MDIRSILVNVDLDTANSTVLRYAINLAQQMDAELIGVAADDPSLAMIGLDGGVAAADFYAMERTEIEKHLAAAEAQFRALVPPSLKSQWRAYLAPEVQSVIDTARVADLIVTGATKSPTFQEQRRVDLAQLILGAGRPVLDVAQNATAFACDKIVIGWKDTREARRAVADAVPFLQRAKHVLAVTVGEGDRAAERGSLDDLLAWLARHGVTASADLIENKEGFVDVLESTSRTYQADLVVSGAYGHSRMREWLFGGMTRNLLQANTLNRLFSN